MTEAVSTDLPLITIRGRKALPVVQGGIGVVLKKWMRKNRLPFGESIRPVRELLEYLLAKPAPQPIRGKPRPGRRRLAATPSIAPTLPGPPA
jgi:hypothetical protein